MFLNMLNKIKNKIAAYNNYYYIKNIINGNNKFQNKKKYVFFDFETIAAMPYQFGLILSFADLDYNIVLQPNKNWIGSFIKYRGLLLNMPNITIKNIAEIDKKKYICITDKKQNNKNNWKKYFCFNYNSFTLSIQDYPNQLMMPFMMHPNNLETITLNKIEKYRQNIPKMRVFFSGNQEKKSYTNPIFKSFFHQMNRIEILDTLIEHLDKNKIVINKKIDDSKNIEKKGYQNKFILNQWRWNNDNDQDIDTRTKNENWLEQLSYTDFFLACPGVNHPLCHNIIEAMSVGCIPILEYDNYFYPSLQHNKNAYFFKGEADLITKMNQIFEMSAENIKIMKQNVIDYYENYLKPEVFIKKLEQDQNNQEYIYIFAGIVSHLAAKTN